jgi:hypothetical protein
VPREVLLDNAKALILHHDPVRREVVLHPRLHAFPSSGSSNGFAAGTLASLARHWGFRIRACAPYRAHTEGNDERGVGYVKRNAIAGRHFASWSAMEAHLEAGPARSRMCGCMARRVRRRANGLNGTERCVCRRAFRRS